MIRITKNSRKDRSFGIFLGLLCFAVCGYQYLESGLLNYTVGGMGLFLLVPALFSPFLYYPFRRLMEIIGNFMGILNTYVLLTLIFVLLFIPIGLILKVTEKDSLKRKWDSKAPSYWIERLYSKTSSMKNQF